MAKVMTIGGLVVAGLLAVVFGLDLIVGVPFDGASMWMDAGFLLSGLILGYMSWNAMKSAK